MAAHIHTQSLVPKINIKKKTRENAQLTNMPFWIELSDIFSLIKWEQCGRYFLTVEMWGDSSTK